MAERRIQDAHGTWPGASVHPSEVRASDAERERVITALQQHFVDGRITNEELTQRIDYLVQTRTRGALTEVTRDLPSPAPPAVPPGPATAPRRHHEQRRRPAVAAFAAALVAALLVLPVLAAIAVGGPPGVWQTPPLLTIFLVWMVVRLTTRSRWR